MKSRNKLSRHRVHRSLGMEPLEQRQLLSAAPWHASAPSAPAEGESSEVSVAQRWNEALLDAIRVDTPRPTVHARNLFHTSVAMYDAWAAYHPAARGYFVEEWGVPAGGLEAARAEAMSYAAYRVLVGRFTNSPGAATSLPAFDALMQELGYDPNATTTVGSSPAAVGNRIGQHILQIGLADGSNEANNYADTTGYTSVNAPLDVSQSGATLIDPNRWQPLLIGGATQSFLTPHWGQVRPFALERADADDVYHEPAPPPQLGGATDQVFKDAVLRVIHYSASLDPDLTTTIDISPGAIGNNTLGTDDGQGHAINPATGQPYTSQLVKLGDYGRVLAEFWADGPNSETPPGHWNTIANELAQHEQLERRIGGEGPIVNQLEWDVKLYFALNGAVHDAAIAAWDAKEAHDYVRPISMIRYMGGLGQSSDPNLPSYGLPLEDGLVELITTESTAAGQRHEHLAGHEGEIAIFAWAGHPDSSSSHGGSEWILATDWLPYQAFDFVTPAFPGFVSGHSTFSRAAAEVLTHFTGDPFFPGGVGSYAFDANGFLKFEQGPSEPITLQWATYYDAADEAGVSRIYGGIHVDADDYEGRILGSKIGIAAYQKAARHFDPAANPVIEPPENRPGRWLLRKSGSQLQLIDQDSLESRQWPLESLHSLTIIGADQRADTLTVDLSGGSFQLPGQLHFVAGTDADDQLVIHGTDQADEFSLSNGALQANGLGVLYGQVERIDLNGAEADDRYELAVTDTRLMLTDSGGQDTLDFSAATSGLWLRLGLDRGQVQPIGAGNKLSLVGTFEQVIGTAFNDQIWGNSFANTLEGSGGEDRLFGHGGDDLLRGGDGHDVLYGGLGEDRLEGGPDDDRLFGGFGDDHLDGGPGNDRLVGGFGDDTLANGEDTAHRFLRQNPFNQCDVNIDDLITPLDALLVINHLRSEGPGPVVEISSDVDIYIDVSGDDFVGPIDALLVINVLNRLGELPGEGEGKASDLAGAGLLAGKLNQSSRQEIGGAILAASAPVDQLWGSDELARLREDLLLYGEETMEESLLTALARRAPEIRQSLDELLDDLSLE